MDDDNHKKVEEFVVGPMIRVHKDSPPECLGIGILKLPGETVYEAPDVSSGVGYSAAYSAAYEQIFSNKTRPEELN